MPKLKTIDFGLIVPLLSLAAFGLLAIYSSVSTEASAGLFWRHTGICVAAAVLFATVSLWDYSSAARLNKWLYLLTLVLLILTLIIAPEVRGARRWLDFGPVQLQTAELAKLAVVLGLSRWLFLEKNRINTLGILARTAAFTFLPAALIIKQPDLGSGFTILSIWIGLLAISRAKIKILALIAALGILAAGFSWQYLLHDFQRERIQVFLNPEHNLGGSGYNVRQSIIAVGSGGWLGKGIGQGSQSQLKFLPERRTDFVFAGIAEELGFVGASLVIILYAWLLQRIWTIAKTAKDALGAYCALGIWWWFFAQITINIGMNIGLLPVTGVPLIFISYGGSSLLASAAALGLVHNISRQSMKMTV